MAISFQELTVFPQKVADFFGEDGLSPRETIAHGVLLVLLFLVLVTSQTAGEGGSNTQEFHDITPLLAQALPVLFVEIKGEKYSVRIHRFEECGSDGGWCAAVEVPELSDDDRYYDLVPISQLHQ